MPGFSESRFQPRRINAFGAPPSIDHSCTSPLAVVTFKKIREWGLVNTILITSPLSSMG